ncbi:MAG: hypothetical protein IPK19_08975 [Chloroflexi bacterium]|nr:hypothetical protein [Chloroflexota bacterium]
MSRLQARRQRRRVLLGGVVAALVLVMVAGVLVASRSSGPALTNAFELSPTTLRFNYPQDWQYSILETNIIFLASPEVLRQEPGASMVIQRSQRLMVETDSLEEALDTYLQRGPLLNEGDWAIAEAPEPVRIGETDGLRVGLEGKEGDDAVPLYSTITALRAGNGTIYVLATSAPLDQKSSLQPMLDAVLASVRILE